MRHKYEINTLEMALLTGVYVISTFSIHLNYVYEFKV